MEDRLITLREAAQLLGIGRASIYTLRNEDPTFPKFRQISPRRVAVLASELQKFISTRPVATETEEHKDRQARGEKAAKKAATVIKASAAERRASKDGKGSNDSD